jgi:hypothetical protein
MRRLPRFLLLLCCLLAWSGLAAAEPSLTLSHEGKVKKIGAADLAGLPQVEVETLDHGVTHRYRGVAVRDVLALVDAPLGSRLRGRAVGLVVKVTAADGYVAAFALAEFDRDYRAQDIVLADRRDGAPLPDEAGPLRFVCPGDQRGARSIRQVREIEILSLGGRPPRESARPTTPP